MTTKASGKIYLIGIGPGATEQMTPKAQQAIQEADFVVGYKTYLTLIKDLLTSKQVIGSGMRQELERCSEACRLAMNGHIVALISSGDVGVYGMAGPTYEILLKSGWQPQSGVEVEIIPGVTALTACAARIGAPLTHDFCAISLSDLLTPWSIIEKRLKAAAMADFVTALYNPKSGKRAWQIVETQRIFLEVRTENTPVAVVTSAYRKKENIILTDLAQMTQHDIDMQTTVLIGNSQTFVQHGVMITPRGYADKYTIQPVTETIQTK